MLELLPAGPAAVNRHRMPRTLTDEDVEAIARRVVEIQREMPPAPMVDQDPWFTRREVEKYLGVSRHSFWRLRREFPDALKPCSEKPLRWSKRHIDGWKLSRSLPASCLFPRRRGRPRKSQ